jgi:hypothetical protein
MDPADGELRRVRGEAFPESSRVLVVRVFFDADHPAAVIACAREVLTLVLENRATWPADETWSSILPRWFVDRCAPEGPDLVAEAWFAEWRAMTPEAKAAFSREPWTLSGWLYHFDPADDAMGKDRSWWWWDAGIGESGRGWIDVATNGLPFGSGSLYWLIEASGGQDPDY